MKIQLRYFEGSPLKVSSLPKTRVSTTDWNLVVGEDAPALPVGEPNSDR